MAKRNQCHSGFICLGFGICVITLSFVMLYTFDIREWNVRTIFKAQVNLNELVKMVKNYNENSPETRPAKLEAAFKEVLNSMEQESYLFLYCQMREPERLWVYHPRQEFPITTTLPNLITLDVNHIVEQQLLDRLQKKKYYLKSIYSYLICQSEKVYFLIVIISSLTGCVLIICGSIKIYANNCGENGHKQKNHVEEAAENEEKSEEQTEGCCLRVLLKTLYTEIRPSRNASGTSAFSRLEANLLRPNTNSFMLVKQCLPTGSDTEGPIPSDVREMKARAAKKELMAPFIYEDLPAFYQNQPSTSNSVLNTSVSQQDNWDTNGQLTNSSRGEHFETRGKPLRSHLSSVHNTSTNLDASHVREFLLMPDNQYGDGTVVPRTLTKMCPPSQAKRQNPARFSVPASVYLSDEFNTNQRIFRERNINLEKPVSLASKQKRPTVRSNESSLNEGACQQSNWSSPQAKLVRGRSIEADYTECNL